MGPLPHLWSRTAAAANAHSICQGEMTNHCSDRRQTRAGERLCRASCHRPDRAGPCGTALKLCLPRAAMSERL